MTLTLSIATLIVLVGGVVLLAVSAGCERISRAIDALKRSPSARVASAILGVAMIVGTAGTQLQAARTIQSAGAVTGIVTSAPAGQVMVAPTAVPTAASAQGPLPDQAKAKPTPVDPERFRIPAVPYRNRLSLH